MKSKASAPGKVILFGEHFVVYGVKAILCAIDRRATVTAEQTDDQVITVRSEIGQIRAEPGRPITEIDPPLRPFYHLADRIIRDGFGIRMDIESDIPPGVGLGSSSACCVAGAAAVLGLYQKASREEVLGLAIDAERTIFQNTSGADCTVCTFGGLMEYDRENGFSRIESEPSFQMVIANSNVEHSTDSVVAGVRRFKGDNEEEFAELCRSESILIEEAMEMLRADDARGLGQKAAQNQKYLERIGVSNDMLEDMIRTGHGPSFGAKITGAGGGGCILALADESNLGETTRALQKDGRECFSARIDFKGLDTF